MKLADLFEEEKLKMPGVMKSLIVDLQRLVPWKFERITSLPSRPEKNFDDRIWFRALEPEKEPPNPEAGNLSSSSRGYIHVLYRKWPTDSDEFQVTVNTKGPHNDKVREIVVKHREHSKLKIGGTASYPDRTQLY